MMTDTSGIRRKNMVKGQLLPNGIVHRGLIESLYDTPREMFVPRNMQDIAYIDDDIVLPNGCVMMSPMVLARMIDAADIAAGDVVLDIGCMTGYATALVAPLCATVIALETDAGNIAAAEKNLQELGACNAVVMACDALSSGYPEQAPYDVIIVEDAVPRLKDDLLTQLADGGRLVAVVSGGAARGQRSHRGKAVLVTRRGDTFMTRILFDTALTARTRPQTTEAFVFQ